MNANATVAAPMKADLDSIARIVFREVLPGDIRKFEGLSNDSPTGGGARDFRFRPYDKFDDVFARLLTGRTVVGRAREGAPANIEIYTSAATVLPEQRVVTMEFEPPTTARPDEGRLTRLSSYGLTVPKNEGRVLLLAWQTYKGLVFTGFATEKQITDQEWHRDLNNELGQCLHSSRPANHAGQGFIDFERGTRYIK